MALSIFEDVSIMIHNKRDKKRVGIIGDFPRVVYCMGSVMS